MSKGKFVPPGVYITEHDMGWSYGIRCGVCDNMISYGSKSRTIMCEKCGTIRLHGTKEVLLEWKRLERNAKIDNILE